MTIHKILKYLALVIGVIGLILLGRIIMAGDDVILASAADQNSLVTPFLYLAYFVFAIVVVLVAFYVLKGLFRGNIKNTLISVGSFVAIIVIAYVLTDGTEIELKDGDTLSASGSHWVGAGLVVFYILAAIAVGAMVLSGVKKLIK
jgi:membrane protease YdiL (CAAX protease family)